MSPAPPGTFDGAVDAWTAAHRAVVHEPTDEHLQQLCTLLDVMDREIVKRWGKPGHAERVTALAQARRSAGRANRLVSARREATRSEQGRTSMAKRSQQANVDGLAGGGVDAQLEQDGQDTDGGLGQAE